MMKKCFQMVLAIVAIPTVIEGAPPNFLFLLSDDQDWTGLSVQMHPEYEGARSRIIETPNIERLAREGMRFSAAYSPSSVCSATRISLQTGQNPARLRWTKAAPVLRASARLKLIPPPSRKSIMADEVTLGEVLQEAGYATAHFGKWHLGGGGPERHGYDASDGETGNGHAAPYKGDNPVDIFGMNERAVVFMGEAKEAGRPFFVQMSYHALHYPENASPEAVAKYEAKGGGGGRGSARGVGRAAISDDLDRGVGELMESLDEMGLADNTYVIYMSDNGGGGPAPGSQRPGRGGEAGRPLVGGKGSVWEGGIRVPLIIRGPGVEAGSWSHERVVGFDLFPTLCVLAEAEEEMPEGIEGGDFSHLLRGEEREVERAREELVFHFPHYQGDTPHSAVLVGGHKLIKFYETGETRLFDLDEDIGEGNDLSAAMPERAAELEAILEVYLEEADALLPEKNPGHVPGVTYSGEKGGGKKGPGGPGGGSGARKKR
ncbi:MAG: sulfatase [Verrucomicrobiota bacterium]